MRFWMNVMRRLEPFLNDHERLLDAWGSGGCDGIVIGPLMFNQPRLGKGAVPISSEGAAVWTYDPDSAIYERFGVEAPPPPPDDPMTDRRKLLDRALTAAKDLGWSVWIFQPSAGAGPGGTGHYIVDEHTRRAVAARAADTLRHYPMADGAVFDGPEWGYEVDPGHRSYIFADLPDSVRAGCERLGYDYADLCRARDALFDRLHSVQTPADAFGDAPGLARWLRFRVDSLTDFYRSTAEMVRGAVDRPVKLACGPRTASFSSLAGYDMHALAECMDALLPKLYFWHRGFDGMIGTIDRYVETLTAWNPGLSDADALTAVEALFGLRLPGVENRLDLESALSPEFYATIARSEARLALDAVGGRADRLAPWVDAGRFPHDGDPMPPRDLRFLLAAASDAGLTRFTYHHSENLTAGEWNLIAEACGAYPLPRQQSYRPADELVL